MKYKRVLFKISGEVLSGNKEYNIDRNMVVSIAEEIKKLHDTGVQIAIVVGGGNIWRGRYDLEMDRVKADHMGMLATTINALALSDALLQLKIEARVQTAISMIQVSEPYIRNRAIRHLEKNRIVILACGTGNPYFTTDSAAALRACELNVDALMLAKNVDGVYDKDPNKYDDAKKFDKLTYMEVLTKELNVMDTNAVCLCKDNNVEIIVFDLNTPSNINKIFNDTSISTIIKND